MQVPAIKVRAAGTRHRFRVLRTAFIIFAVLMASMLLGAGQLWAQCGSLNAPSTTWQNGGNSFWDLSGNWTSGTPTASTNACILNGTSTVELNTNGNANGLQLATGNTLNIDSGASLTLGPGKSLIDGLLFNSSGTITNSGKLTNGGFDRKQWRPGSAVLSIIPVPTSLTTGRSESIWARSSTILALSLPTTARSAVPTSPPH